MNKHHDGLRVAGRSIHVQAVAGVRAVGDVGFFHGRFAEVQVGQFSPDERKRGIDFALRVLSQLENTVGKLDDAEEPAPTRLNGMKRRSA